MNGQKIIDNLMDHGSTENSGTIALTAGQSATVLLEYYNASNAGLIHLSWMSNSQSKAIIPASALTPQ